MELRKRLNPKFVFVGLYLTAFLAFIVYGLQPAEIVEAYNIDDKLIIPSIGLESDVTGLSLQDGELDTPDVIVGSYSRAENKTLLIGHSRTVFRHLDAIKYGDEIEYGGRTYKVTKIEMVAKDKINMKKLLSTSKEDTLILMTCAGKMLDDVDATHRMIITAIR